jgi:hypothetical protein
MQKEAHASFLCFFVGFSRLTLLLAGGPDRSKSIRAKKSFPNGPERQVFL